MPLPKKENILWAPNPKQAIALASPVFELFFGGSRFGGKTDYLLIDFLDGVKLGENHRGIMFRRTYNELEEIIFRSRQLYPHVGGQYSETKRTWTFPGGSAIKLRFLELEQDVHRYQGHAYTFIAFDELTNWPNDYCYLYMHSCARSAHGLPVRVRASGNPGSVGHGWVKSRFVDVGKPMTPYIDPVTELPRMFVPSFLDDNPFAANDPDYVRRLKSLPPHLYQAHRFGDWSVFVGQAFEIPREATISPIPIPEHAPLYLTFDWGFGAPFSVGWWWTDSDDNVYRCGEWYGYTGKAGEGLRLTDTEIAQGIVKQQEVMGIHGRRIHGIAGPDCFQKKPDYRGGGQGSPTAEVFAQSGVYISPGDANRIHKIKQFRERLLVQRKEDGTPISGPRMFIYDTYTQFLRTIPALTIDPRHPEDIDTKGEDHVYDEACHICMARPIGLRPKKDVWVNPFEERIKNLESPRTDDLERELAYHNELAWKRLEGEMDPYNGKVGVYHYDV